MEAITERNNKLKSLLAIDTITEDTMNELIAAETDDSLAAIYESILDEIQSNQTE
jgi:hypothetical protein